MDRFAARLDEYLTREQPEPTACECGNGLHYEIDRELGQCADCRAEAAHEEERAAGYCNDFGSDAAGPADDEELAAVAAEANEERTARKRTAHVVAAEAIDADALFIGAATEAPPALVRSLIVATSRTQLAAVRAQGRAGL